jgi:predicted DNA-binding transcriptional regulator YafY
MNRMDRLLGIVLELQRRGNARAEDLAAKFETSKRTIYRDMQALSETGVPVVAEAGKGYSLVEGYFLPPLSFTTDEATMLVLGGDLIAQHFDAQYRAAVQTATAKLETVLSDKLRQEVNYLRASIAFVVPETLASKETAQRLPVLRRAIIERRTVRFHYHTRRAQDGEPARKWRDADPYGMYHYGDAWYLMAFCHLRQESRSFRLDRLSQLKLLDNTFERPAGFSMEPPEDTARQIVVRVLFDEEAAPWVRESRAYYVKTMEETPDGLMVTLHVHAERELMQWLLYWGSHARVLEPAGLREVLAEEGRKIFEKYSD